MRSTYVWLFLVPVAAKALSGIGESITIPAFSPPIELVVGLPFSWVLFYVGAVLFTLANVVYSGRCPVMIREHATAAEFRSAGKSRAHLETYVAGIGKADEYRQVIKDIPENNPIEFDKAYWQIRRDADTAHPWSRGICSVLYLLGLAAVSIVLVQNARYVIEQAIP